MRRAFRVTRLLLAACFILAARGGSPQTPTPPKPFPESAYHPRSDTWLKVLGAPGASDFMAGTSVVSEGNGSYIVAAGFTPGLANDIGLLQVGSDGQVQFTRFTSDRNHSGGLGSKFLGNTLFVKALSLGGGRVSLTFDNVWLPEVGTQSPIPGWQIMLGLGNNLGLALTDQIKVGNDFFLRLAVGRYGESHLGLLKVTPDGKISVKVNYPNVLVDRAGKLFLTADGFLLTAGYIRSPDGSERAVVLWLNQDGSLEHSVTVEMDPYKLHPDAPFAHSGGYQILEQLTYGDIILVQNFQICSIVCPGSGALITRLDSSGTEKWTVGLHSLGAIGGQTFISGIQEEGNDKGDQLLIVGGSHAYLEPGNYSSHLNVMMASLNYSDGKPTWLRSLGPKNYTGTDHEFKTDYANALLLTGDGRMLFTGTTDSFGSGQAWTDGPYYQHFDLLLGMASTVYGGIQGSGALMWSLDLTDKYQVWDDEKTINWQKDQCSECTMEALQDIFMDSYAYTPEPMVLMQRDLANGFLPDQKASDLKVSYQGRYLVGNSTFFTTDPAKDIDDDGLDQVFESTVADLVEPILVLQKNKNFHETWFDHMLDHHVINFVRVTPYPSRENPVYILIEYAVTWSMDYGARAIPKYPIRDHRGDIEKVIEAWRLESDRSMRLEWVFTSAHDSATVHEGVWNAYDRTCNRGSISDTGANAVGTELMCTELEFRTNRVYLYVSQDKHAIYPSIQVCNDLTLVTLQGVKIWSELCGGGGGYLPPTYNVGEVDHHLINNLDDPSSWEGLSEAQKSSLTGLFPEEKIYDINSQERAFKFCGGVKPPPDGCCPGTVAIALDINGVINGVPGKAILLAKLGPPTYRIQIKTANKKGAGTDAGVYITLYAADDSLHTFPLDGSFEAGKTDIFHIGNPTQRYLGDIAKIGLQLRTDKAIPDYYVKIDGTMDIQEINKSADWYVQEVQVEDELTGNKWIFKVNQNITDSREHTYLAEPGQ